MSYVMWLAIKIKSKKKINTKQWYKINAESFCKTWKEAKWQILHTLLSVQDPAVLAPGESFEPIPDWKNIPQAFDWFNGLWSQIPDQMTRAEAATTVHTIHALTYSWNTCTHNTKSLRAELFPLTKSLSWNWWPRQRCISEHLLKSWGAATPAWSTVSVLAETLHNNLSYLQWDTVVFC